MARAVAKHSVRGQAKCKNQYGTQIAELASQGAGASEGLQQIISLLGTFGGWFYLDFWILTQARKW